MSFTTHVKDDRELCDDCEDPVEDCTCTCYDCGDSVRECACDEEATS